MNTINSERHAAVLPSRPEQAVAFLKDRSAGPWTLAATDLGDQKTLPAQTFDEEGELLNFLYLHSGTHSIAVASLEPDSKKDDLAVKFLVNVFSTSTENPVYISSLPNAEARDSEPGERHLMTRDAACIKAFVRKWDKPKRGLFYCVSTLAPGSVRRCKENVAELNGLHADIDFKSVTATPKEIEQTLREIALLPSKVISSGNGIHVYWHFKEALPATADNVAQVEAMLRRLADHLGGDHAVCEIARLMRLPGSHNTKDGAWAEVKVLEDRPLRYDLVELEEWLSEATPVLRRKPTVNGNGASGDNPSLNFAEQFDIKAPIDVEQRLADMTFRGAGNAAIHTTQLECSAALLNRGIQVDDVVKMLLAATRAAGGKAGARWNWKREERDIRETCSSWLKKHPQPVAGAVVAKVVAASLDSTQASAFSMRGIRWFWPGRFALGKLGLIGGLPDKGKGLISADMIARATKSDVWPCGEGQAPQGNVIWFTAEDDIEDTIIPRLVAAGADLTRVHIIGMAHNPNGSPRMFNLATDLPLLQKKIEEIGNVVLVIIDPVSAYLGVGKINNASTTDVRGVLAPLTKLAEEKQIAIVGVMHFNKKADVTNAMLRIADSLAYVAAARHVYVVVDDAENEQARLFVKAKNNLAPDTHALRFMVGTRKVGFDQELETEIWAPHVLWDSEHVKVTATQAMEAEAGGGPRTARREAEEFLGSKLALGPVPVDDLIEEAEANGISERTLKRAKQTLKARAWKEKGRTDGRWHWELPKVQQAVA